MLRYRWRNVRAGSTEERERGNKVCGGRYNGVGTVCGHRIMAVYSMSSKIAFSNRYLRGIPWTGMYFTKVHDPLVLLIPRICIVKRQFFREARIISVARMYVCTQIHRHWPSSEAAAPSPIVPNFRRICYPR